MVLVAVLVVVALVVVMILVSKVPKLFVPDGRGRRRGKRGII